MNNLFTDEFCEKLDQLNDTQFNDRALEDLILLLADKGIISLSELNIKHQKIISDKAAIRNDLKEMYDNCLKERGDNNG